MFKSQIRENNKNKRQILSQQQIHEKSQLLTENFWKSSFIETISTLHIFLPIQKCNEPDTWLLIRRIWQEKPNVRIVVPKTDWQNQNLKNYFLTPQTPLQKNTWGINEPDETQATICPIEKIDLVLVPLLAFDMRGYRVGYGKGFYDKFLAQCPQATKVGFSLEEPLPEPITDINEYDMRLDHCITPTQIISFAKS
jgi:5-formyltetrahydrofolate cyclo-ligase